MPVQNIKDGTKYFDFGGDDSFWVNDQGRLVRGVSSGDELAVTDLVLTTIITDTGSVGAGEDNLHSFSLPASTLKNDGESVEIEAVVSFAANANAKTVKLHFGSTVLLSSGAQAQNGGSMMVSARVYRTSAAAQRASARSISSGTLYADDHSYTTPAETLSGAITIKVTGEGVADNDIVSKITTVTWKAASK